MEIIIYSLLLIPLFAIINRFCGGGMWLGELWNPERKNKLPGRALYVGVILAFLSALIVHSPTMAFLIAFTFGFWRTWAWGLFIGMGHHIPNRDFTSLEHFLLKIANGNYEQAFLYRNLMMLPGFFILSIYLGSIIPLWIGLLLAITITLIYKYSWEIFTKEPIRLAELISGSMWGISIILLALI